MKIHDATNVDLKTLVNALEAPYDVVTTDTVANARANTPEGLWGMLGIDDAGVVEGVARGYWTQVPA